MKLFLLFLSGLLVSCSLTKMKANKLMEKGYYDEARALYVQVLEDDPGDEEAIVKKKIAERKIINRDLIKIRDQIGSGSFKDALYTSKIVLRNINNWKIETDPNAARFLNVRRKKLFPYFRKHILFQLNDSKPKVAESFFKDYKVLFWDFNLADLSNKIIQGLYSSFKKRIKTILSKNYPLKAELFYKRESDIRFESSELNRLKNKIMQVGRKKCKKLRRNSGKKNFYGLFLKNYCDHFAGAQRSVSSVNSPLIAKDLFSSPEIKANLKGIPFEISKEIEEYMNDIFKKSPWYHPDGMKKVKVSLTGFFKKSTRIQSFNKTHSYTVSIPYTAMVPEFRTRQVPYSTTQYTCSYNYDYGQTCANIPVTKYRTEFYTVNVPVTKYRKERRFFPYISKRYYQRFLLTLNANFKLAKDSEDLNYSNSLSESDEFHDQSLPKIRLYRDPLEISEPLPWLKVNSKTASNKFFNSLKTSWERKYCFPKEKKRSIASIGEAVVRCSRSSSSHSFIDDWHRQLFNLKKDQVESMIGRYSK